MRVTDWLKLLRTAQFNATRESGNADSRVYWGSNFMTVNVDNGDQPVNIDIRPGKYNATQLASEVQRAINAAYGMTAKFKLFKTLMMQLI